MNCMINPGSFTGAIAEVAIGRPDYTLTAVIGKRRWFMSLAAAYRSRGCES
jgi:hypothetical protein